MSKSKADQDRLTAIHNIPCVCCHQRNRRQPLPTEAHHLRGKRYHQETVALCGWHHRAEMRPGDSKLEMLFEFGPSLEYQGTKGAFYKRFGDKDRLLKITNQMLGETP
jgi:hypothetical protein